MREILITATVLILCILLIRRIFRRKIGSRMQYALWLLAALRLVIPVSAEFDLGSFSDFRLMDLVGEDESGIGERLEETIRLEEPIQMTVNSRSILFRLFTTDEIRETLEAMPKDGPTSVFMAGKLGFSRLDVLLFFWGIGGFIIGAWIIITNVVFSHRLKKRRKPFDLPEEVKTAVFGEKNSGLFRKKGRMPAFYAVEGISSPCLYGFPGCEAVYLTADVIGDTDKLRHVIVHELVHKKHGDSLWAVLRGVLVTVYWFHPLVWAAAVCSKRDCELACDEGALAALGEKERVPYGETLLSIITQKGHMSDLVCTATTMTGSGKSVKERIRFIAEKPKVFYAAAAGVLFLIAVVCLFVFTRDTQFHGTVVDAQEGLLVTGGDMQIPLPASIGGISGCVVEKESDEAVIYHLAAQEEVGRFARMPLKDALGLVDEGREVTPIGDYGYNYLLRAYLGEPLSRTEHTYTPAKEAATDYQPGMDEAGTAGETAGVPGTDMNDDTTYMIDDSGYRTEEVQEAYEGKTDYLPNEQIVEITYEPDEVNVDELHSGCYVYVKADFDGKVRDKYQEEMAYIDEELKTVVYRVIVLSLNRENRDALFDSLAANRTPYVGDHSKVGALLEALPLPPTLNREAGFSLQTLESPYALRFDYKMCMDHFTKDDQDMLYFNAAMLFYAIGNLEEIAVGINRPAGTEPADMMEVYYREELGQDIPALLSADFENEVAFREKLSTLHSEVESYLSSYNFYNF